MSEQLFHEYLREESKNLPDTRNGLIPLIQLVRDRFEIGLKESAELVRNFVDQGYLLRTDDKFEYNPEGNVGTFEEITARQQEKSKKQFEEKSYGQLTTMVDRLGYERVVELLGYLNPDNQQEGSE